MTEGGKASLLKFDGGKVSLRLKYVWERVFLSYIQNISVYKMQIYII